jgi:hypothetical protein
LETILAPNGSQQTITAFTSCCSIRLPGHVELDDRIGYIHAGATDQVLRRSEGRGKVVCTARLPRLLPHG